jgi:hypothetical protein
MADFLNNSQHNIKRDALRSLRGSILRKEIYALDANKLQDRPYSVTEYLLAFDSPACQSIIRR